MSRLTQVTKKSRNSLRSNEEDYISKLPESIITQILSSLPTKEAVRTSVLSKDWEYKWHSIYNISVNDAERFSGRRSNKTSFTNFVNKLLFLTHEIRSFRLSCRINYDCGQVEGWMSSVLKCDIERLEFRALGSITFHLPRSILNKTSLKILKLKSFCTFKVPADNHFPNLTYLHLRSVRVNTKFPNTLFTFPALKTLKVKKCKWINANLFEFRAPVLSRFVCETAWKIGDYSLKISGARQLERFESTGLFPEDIILYETTVLNAIFLNNPSRECTQEESVLNAQKLLKLFSSATSLLLSQWTYKVMVLAEQELLLPKYDKLQRLVMCVWRDTKLLFELLHSTPSLKYLEIYGNWDELSHEEVDYVPHCVASHLEELKFVSIYERPLSDLALFFLTNGAVLKKVRISDYFSLNVRLVEEILKYPRASAYVEFGY